MFFLKTRPLFLRAFLLESRENVRNFPLQTRSTFIAGEFRTNRFCASGARNIWSIHDMMNLCGEQKGRTLAAGLKILFLIILILPSRAGAEPDYSPLVETVFAYNQKALESSLADGSYRGEEGFLRMPAEVAQSFGMKVYVDEDYLKARDLYEQAQAYLEDAVEGMSNQSQEKTEGEYADKVSRSSCLYQKTIRSADELLKSYRTALMLNKDERFDRSKCSALLQDLIKKALKDYGQNLRDALGCVYNRCQGIEPLDGYPLTSENVGFVNYVFNDYVRKARPGDLEALDLDKLASRGSESGPGVSKDFLGKTELRYFSYLEPALKRYGQGEYADEPLLFLALMRQESRFDPKAVSYVGAAGITQIMPSTGKLLGMTTIFSPPYFGKAREFLLKERRLMAKAMVLVSKPEEDCVENDARQARQTMQQALSFKEKRVAFYRRYRRELLQDARDDRFNPRKAIEGGYRLFAELLKRQKGDISLTLAAYNAGSRAVKKYNGLPPYPETVSYRNRVLRYYREYLDRAGLRGAGVQKGG
jgi:Transglycosylase SLT domain